MITAGILPHPSGHVAVTSTAGHRRGTELFGTHKPVDIADVVALFASPEGRWLTGQIVHATGGLA